MSRLIDTLAGGWNIEIAGLFRAGMVEQQVDTAAAGMEPLNKLWENVPRE